MGKSDRLFDILQILRDGELHTAQALAERFQVSVRTLYRDMDRLAASGVPLVGTRGTGYRLADLITLPPISLTAAELEALNLGIAIAAELADPALKAAANTLAEKLDAAQPETSQAEAWRFGASPFSDAARGFAHLPTLRAAIKARQKLRITYTSNDGGVTSRSIRPLHLEYWNRIWALTAWCELRAAHRIFRLDLISSAEALPELFTDEAGKTLADFRP
ncbi:helix-turn-helix transcriptional regulator [Sulfitobacter donghicola]|uniref:Transcriptional regulator n=1 Tax=Sulfitobacter donghicola DSW-25 = KCTC 12864 = JCM 14565 TaxID=1300350 RepID=A0A073IIW3_9RHOB|nr:YafY family protein [Sulfitobacter donghicola]KEJ89451.1 transcriptional regulator [Sulfitobacter donghicola DSW-25 = KCTC 12864 = JCM 14565]KIN69271.1 putative helix-turn-helix protein [Sulfitobacter donghicola DSW-25 = KCTC 12864 = JCM 14565]